MHSFANQNSVQLIRAVLFDLDGTLVDSEPLWHRADARWLSDHNITLSDDEWVHIIGMGGGPFVRMLQKEKGLAGDYHQLLEEKNEVFRAMAATESVAFPEMLRFAHGIRSRGVKTAIASASSIGIIETTLQCIGELDSFDMEFSADMVERSKPEPDLFLFAARELGVEPEQCLVIEDSQYGVEAGKRAGMTVVGVPYHIPPESRYRFESADLLFSRGMAEFSAEVLFQWLEDRNLI
jgi:HAD superfamily hydrolase (TIGR01509 family)